MLLLQAKCQILSTIIFMSRERDLHFVRQQPRLYDSNSVCRSCLTGEPFMMLFLASVRQRKRRKLRLQKKKWRSQRDPRVRAHRSDCGYYVRGFVVVVFV